jgi:hypothetical protein
MFVELQGHSEEDVASDIRQTLMEVANRREFDFRPIQSRIAGMRCASVMALIPSPGLWTPIA